jgi:SNF2 family DNA or RNA helicase
LFEGTLRPYPAAGYNWLRFLNNSNLVAVADDMGWENGPSTFILLASEEREESDIPHGWLLKLP